MNRVAKIACCLVLCALFFCAGARCVLAEQTVLSDPLTSWPLNFGAQGSSVSLKNGAVHVTAPANSAGWSVYNGFNFTDMDASVTVASESPTGNVAGLLFWATGPSDFFDFAVSNAAGTFAIYRRVSANASPWQTIVPATVNTNIKTGPTATNTLRVVTKGNSVSLFVNGQPMGSLNVMAPAGGGTVGIEGEGGAKGPSDYVFSDLTVSQ